MPCRNDGYECETVYYDISRLEAMLCGLLSVIEGNNQLESVLKKVDCREAGIKNNDIIDFWTEHKKKDKLRKEREAKEKARETAKKKALSKLTVKEKKLLNLD